LNEGVQMNLIVRLLEIIIPVLLIVAIGYAYARRRRPDMTLFNRIALEVCTPLLTYSALASRQFDIAQHIPLLVGGTLIILGAGLVAWPLALAARQSPRTLVPVVMFNNCGNMGIPLALLAFGPQQMGAAVALYSISNLIHFSIGARITSAGARTRDLLLSPMMLATVLGFASAMTEVRPPQVLLTGMKMLGDASLPMMLFALGARLCSVELRSLQSGVLGALARPLIGMALAWPLVYLLDLEGTARAQLLLFAALPPAVLQFMLAERFEQEPEKVAAMVMLGNILALVFVPLGLAMGMG
jgi:predicted permease